VYEMTYMVCPVLLIEGPSNAPFPARTGDTPYRDKKKSVWAVLINNIPITCEICMHVCRKSDGKTDV